MTATVVTSVLTALLMNARFHGRAVVRAAITLPYAVPEVAAVLVWTWMLSQQFGVLNVFARVGAAACPRTCRGSPTRGWRC